MTVKKEIKHPIQIIVDNLDKHKRKELSVRTIISLAYGSRINNISRSSISLLKFQSIIANINPTKSNKRYL